jgi:hypothetical protein
MTDIDGAIRSLRIIVAAMLASLLGMAALAAALRSELAPSFNSDVQNGLLGLAGLLALASASAYFVLQRGIRADLERQARTIRASAEPLLGVLTPYRRLVVLRTALIEGPALLGLLTYLIGGSEAGLVIAGGSAILLMTTMPSRDALQRFADELRE